MKHRVTVNALHLRSAPYARANTKMAILTYGHLVELEGTQVRENWARAKTSINNLSLTGYLNIRYLIPEVDFEEPERIKKIESVHLQPNRRTISRRNFNGGRAYPLKEENMPFRIKSESLENKKSALIKIIDWLDVENSVRYLPFDNKTFCNIYAHDFCYLANVYLPRVWWMENALINLSRGNNVIPRYGETLRELNVNSIFVWLREWGETFGWKRIFSLDQLQNTANNGNIGLIIGQRDNENRSGHITVVTPEFSNYGAIKVNGTITRPLQSHAGSTNDKYMNNHWWTNSRYREYAFYINEST
ncbi:hypothetical protein [Lunatibacter salilacus]|uniref:hypothetical protein n=1 Tax=Lunatibacter salilacus TaxID=2483804 RepID=UPI00131D2A1D|nr:hypothetical protein [Lunatibacter salilacus]